jgi:hypothetical protein
MINFCLEKKNNNIGKLTKKVKREHDVYVIHNKDPNKLPGITRKIYETL